MSDAGHKEFEKRPMDGDTNKAIDCYYKTITPPFVF
jgi:hypothetical protein